MLEFTQTRHVKCVYLPPSTLKEGEEDWEDKAIFLFFQVYPVLQVDADASNLSFGSIQDDADTSNISFGSICVRQEYAIELSIDYTDYYYVLKAKSRALTILLNEVSLYCLKRYCASMLFAAPREEAESYLWTSSPARVFLVRVLFTKIYRSDLSWIGLFACRTDRSRVEPVWSHHQHLYALFAQCLSVLMVVKRTYPRWDYFSSLFRSMAMDNIDFMLAPNCAIFRSNLLAWRAPIACDSQNARTPA